jgi:hypothetical protein
MARPRIHNEWFMPIAKTSCPCGERKVQCYSWGEYANGKWRTVQHFCQSCFATSVLPRLIAHAGPCGCSFAFNARTGHTLPTFIKEAEGRCNVKRAAYPLPPLFRFPFVRFRFLNERSSRVETELKGDLAGEE